MLVLVDEDWTWAVDHRHRVADHRSTGVDIVQVQDPTSELVGQYA